MIGAIAGDIIGSAYEFHRTKNYDFQLFEVESNYTDDTVLTVAVADCILHKKDYASTFKEYGNKYPNAGYGVRFRKWLGSKDSKPYNSFGNGSAMRVSPVGFAFPTMAEVLKEAKRSAEVTHNHPEGIKGAQSVAAAIFLGYHGEKKTTIKQYIEDNFGYDLNHTVDEIRPDVFFDETCQISVPQAIIAFLDSENYEDAVRNAVSLGGDADTQACIAGGIAQAYYKKVPAAIIKQTMKTLEPELLEMVDEFAQKFGLKY
jgi:ADP-ribosylglycohydrolase